MIEKLVLGISTAICSGIKAIQDNSDPNNSFLSKIGYEINKVPDNNALDNFLGPLNSALGNSNAPDPSSKFMAVATALTNTYSQISDLIKILEIKKDDVPLDSTDSHDVTEFAKRFFGYSFVDYCSKQYPAIYGILLIVGIIDTNDGITELHLNKLVQIFKEPKGVIEDVYYDNGDFNLSKVIDNLILIALSLKQPPADSP